MLNLFRAYRVLAILVGVLLTVLVFVAMPMKYFLTEGSDLQSFGDSLTMVVAIGHGYLYMAYLVVAFFLARKARWTLGFTLLMLVAGLVPVLIFFVEHWVARKFLAEQSVAV